MMTLIAISSYCAAWGILLYAIKNKTKATAKLNLLLLGGLIAHGVAAYHSLLTDTGIHFSFFQAASVLFFVMNSIVVISNLRLPLQNTFVMLLPLSVLALIFATLFDTGVAVNQQLSLPMLTHILLSIVAYSLLTIATLQALLLAYQHRRLKSHHVKPLLGVFPPLQTMEGLLFDFVRAGFLLLTFAIVTGILFIENIFEQQLTHKLVFSALSWCIYVVLLTGRHVVGWRGKIAIRWIIAGFIMLMIAYFGSKFVLEILISRSP